MSPRVLIAGVGNIFLGDDGFGPAAAQRLAAAALPAGVQVVDYGIRGMHLAYDLLDGPDALVLLDATPRAGAPGDLVVLEVGPDDLGSGDFDGHGMAPTAVLASLGSLGGRLPRTFVVGCQPADIGERIGLSPAVAASIDPAVETVLRLLATELQVPADPAGAGPSVGTACGEREDGS
jgi:hydrogenase maturation protease